MHYFERMKIKDVLQIENPMQDMIILGWVRTKRVSKNIAFLEVNDGSTLQNLQVVLSPDEFSLLDEVTIGVAIKAIGDLVKSQGGGQKWEIQVKELSIEGSCPGDYPIQKKRHSLEYLREIAHLRPRTNNFAVINRFRSKVSFAIHQFFQSKGFYYIHSPLITGNDGEGAGETFTVTTLDSQLLGEKKIDYTEDFFGTHTFLAVTGQLEGEVLASALGDVYTFGPTFRAEKSNTYRHLAEFWMIEPEMAFCNLRENMRVMEEFIKYLCGYALNHCQEEMEFFDKWIDSGRIQILESIVNSSFGVVTYTDAVTILQKSGAEFAYPIVWGMDLKSEHERYLTESYFQKPMLVINYPKEIKPFYARLNEDGKTVAAVDLLVPQVGEIIGGSQREERYEMLEERMQESSLDFEELYWYLDLRRWGSVTHSGFGLGFERMLMYLSGMKNIRDVIAFPRTPGNAKF